MYTCHNIIPSTCAHTHTHTQTHVHITHLASLASDKSGKRLGIESRICKPEAPIHAIRSQLERLLPDIVLHVEFRVRLSSFHQLLNLSSPIDEHSNLGWEYPHGRGRVRELELTVAPLVLRGTVGVVYGREADVVLLHDGRIEGVEVKEKDETIVEASFRLENQTPRVGRFSSTMSPARCGPLGALGAGGMFLIPTPLS